MKRKYEIIIECITKSILTIGEALKFLVLLLPNIFFIGLGFILLMDNEFKAFLFCVAIGTLGIYFISVQYVFNYMDIMKLKYDKKEDKKK